MDPMFTLFGWILIAVGLVGHMYSVNGRMALLEKQYKILRGILERQQEQIKEEIMKDA